jgi:hypothetical protein
VEPFILLAALFLVWTWDALASARKPKKPEEAKLVLTVSDLQAIVDKLSGKEKKP